VVHAALFQISRIARSDVPSTHVYDAVNAKARDLY